MTSRVSVILPLPPVILNEVKNRIVTKGKPTVEILHFVQNDKIGKDAFSFVIFACLMQSLGYRNDDIFYLRFIIDMTLLHFDFFDLADYFAVG